MYELAKRVIRLCNSRSEVRFQPIDYSDVNIRVPNTLLAHQLLDYTPKIEIDEGLLKSKAWYKKYFSQIKKFHLKRSQK